MCWPNQQANRRARECGASRGEGAKFSLQMLTRSLLFISSVISRARKRKRRKARLSLLASSSAPMLLLLNLLCLQPIASSWLLASSAAVGLQAKLKTQTLKPSSIPLAYLASDADVVEWPREGRSVEATSRVSNDRDSNDSPPAKKHRTSSPSLRHKRQSNNCSSSSTSREIVVVDEASSSIAAAKNATLEAEQLRVGQLLGRFYELSASSSPSPSSSTLKEPLPRPENLTVLIISWYPPILKLSWQLRDLAQTISTRLDFFSPQQQRGNTTQTPPPPPTTTTTADAGPDKKRTSTVGAASEEDERTESAALAKLSERQQLLAEALSCFQVTYNVVSSR